MNHEDAVFASYYFEAYDDWHKNRRSEVPRAWAIAFDAADGRQVSAQGDLLLGMSAHINRDLPYVFEAIGMVKPDGSSRKPDHDKVNTFLNRVSDELMPELARRFDPTVDDGNLPTTLDDMLSFQAIAAMRETAWRNGERLAAADTPAARAAVAQSIEDYAAAEAEAIRAATAYPPLTGGSSARDAYCAVHHDDVGSAQPSAPSQSTIRSASAIGPKSPRRGSLSAASAIAATATNARLPPRLTR